MEIFVFNLNDLDIKSLNEFYPYSTNIFDAVSLEFAVEFDALAVGNLDINIIRLNNDLFAVLINAEAEATAEAEELDINWMASAMINIEYYICISYHGEL